ncbi:MAG: sigma-70 family RNA polymerase sigma factor, partial [Bacteroidetes bacterium]|nr:sigma-70 family RNA polymerase sigma factor [Bacteroidota bacterium]
QLDDLHYIARVLKGDLNAYTPLVEKYRRYVYVLVKRVCKDSAEAEELAQDVFVKAYEHLGAFRGKSAFSTWLYRIAFNTVVSHARKKKRYGVSLDQIDPRTFAVSDSEEQSEREIRMRREQRYASLERLLANLPANEQLLIALYYTEELKMEEVAEIVGLSLTNTKVKIHRIRQKLTMLYKEE